MRQEILTRIKPTIFEKMQSIVKFFLCILIFVIVLSLVSCHIFGDNSTFIRIHNASEFSFQNVEIQPNVRLVNYGDVKSGEKTGYIPFEKAYAYSFVRFFIDSLEFHHTPIDYVGESPWGEDFLPIN